MIPKDIGQDKAGTSQVTRLDRVEAAIPESRGNGLPEPQATKGGELVPLSSVDWQAHLDDLPMATWISDLRGEEFYVNGACRRLLGVISSEELADRDWEENLHPDDREHYITAWDEFATSSDQRFQQTVRWIRPHNGEIVNLAVRAQRLSSGQFQGWIRPANGEEALEKMERIAR